MYSNSMRSTRLGFTGRVATACLAEPSKVKATVYFKATQYIEFMGGDSFCLPDQVLSHLSEVFTQIDFAFIKSIV
jgi:hypothetical protein